MELLNDGIHNCKECHIYKEYGGTCSSQPTLTLEICKLCETRMCCRAPALPLMECEQNTILDKIEDGEYVEFDGIIPFNIDTKYCKHLDTKTKKCSVYNQRPIACRIAGESCTSTFWVNTLTTRYNERIKHEQAIQAI
jgi:Fe-S-cluster containining protein